MEKLTHKKEWKKPELIVLVKGKQKEAVLVGCKLGRGGIYGPASGNCGKKSPCSAHTSS